MPAILTISQSLFPRRICGIFEYETSKLDDPTPICADRHKRDGFDVIFAQLAARVSIHSRTNRSFVAGSFFVTVVVASQGAI